MAWKNSSVSLAISWRDLSTDETTSSIDDLFNSSSTTTGLGNCIPDADDGTPSGESTSSCVTTRFVCSFLVLGSICAAGIVGNSLSLLVLWPDRNRIPTNFLLIVLAVVDNTVLVTRYFLRAVPAVCDYTSGCQSYLRVSALLDRVIGWPFASFCTLSTNWLTVQITIHR